MSPDGSWPGRAGESEERRAQLPQRAGGLGPHRSVPLHPPVPPWPPLLQLSPSGGSLHPSPNLQPPPPGLLSGKSRGSACRRGWAPTLCLSCLRLASGLYREMTILGLAAALLPASCPLTPGSHLRLQGPLGGAGENVMIWRYYCLQL